MAFNVQVAEEILRRISDGESLRMICKDDHLPSRHTILRWLWGEDQAANAWGFNAKYARARETQADHMDDLILETALNVTSESAPAARVKIDALKWRASKLKPKVYGDKVVQEHTGKGGGPIQTIDLSKATDEQLAALEALLGGVAASPSGSPSGDPGRADQEESEEA